MLARYFLATRCATRGISTQTKICLAGNNVNCYAPLTGEKSMNTIKDALMKHLLHGVFIGLLPLLLLRAGVAQASSPAHQKTWKVVSSPNAGISDQLNAVVAISTTDVWAVGDYVNSSNVQQTLIEHWDGTQWSIFPSPAPGSYSQLYGVARVPGTKQLWAVGGLRCCHLSVKNYRFPDNLPRCQAPSTNRLSHIMWRGIVRLSFSVLHFSFCQISRLVRQDIWEMRQEMPANGRISGASQVYLLQIGERNPRFQHDGSGRQS